jgi:hypothetical protein
MPYYENVIVPVPAVKVTTLSVPSINSEYTNPGVVVYEASWVNLNITTPEPPDPDALKSP